MSYPVHKIVWSPIKIRPWTNVSIDYVKCPSRSVKPIWSKTLNLKVSQMSFVPGDLVTGKGGQWSKRFYRCEISTGSGSAIEPAWQLLWSLSYGVGILLAYSWMLFQHHHTDKAKCGAAGRLVVRERWASNQKVAWSNPWADEVKICHSALEQGS